MPSHSQYRVVSYRLRQRELRRFRQAARVIACLIKNGAGSIDQYGFDQGRQFRTRQISRDDYSRFLARQIRGDSRRIHGANGKEPQPLPRRHKSSRREAELLPGRGLLFGRDKARTGGGTVAPWLRIPAPNRSRVGIRVSGRNHQSVQFR